MIRKVVAIALWLYAAPAIAQQGNAVGPPPPSLPLSAANGGTGASSIPNFKVTLTSNQSVTASTWTKILFDTVSFDVGSYWNTTNKNYVPLVAGTYLFCTSVTINATFTLANDNYVMSISKNGLANAGGGQTRALTHAGSAPTLVAEDEVAPGCVPVPMNGSTDTIEVDVFITGTTPLVGGGSAFTTIFTGYRISP